MWNRKTITKKEELNSNKSVNSINLIIRRGDQLHEATLIVVALYGLFFTVLDFFLDDILQSAINITLVPSALISYVIFKNGNTTESKIWILIHVIIIISLHSLIRSPQSMILAFFFPLIISTLIVFQGETKRLGYLFTALVLIVLIFLITTNLSINDNKIINSDLLRREWLMNLTGALLVTVWEVIFILSINTSIQNELLAKTDDLSEINDSLNSIIKTREKLISILSHDFRGPVITINAGLEMLYEDEMESAQGINPQKEKIFIELLKKTKSTINLMDDLLLWSRSQTNQINCHSEITNIKEIRENIERFCDLYSGVKNIKFNIETPQTGKVLGDKKLLNGIFLNLISNAVKFSNTDSKIDIKATEKDNKWEFSIADQGVGIDESIINQIKSGQYYTTNGTENERGHGLGLQLVREFLEKHDSNLEIASEIGKGTTMSFKLSAA